MKKVTVLLASFTVLSILLDMIHGQHNGDAHRTYIHGAELVFILSLFGVLILQAHRKLVEKLNLSGWAAALCLAFGSLISGFAMFGVTGGSAHGDGGPIAVAFGIMGCLGVLGLPITLIGGTAKLLVRRNRA